MLIAARIIFLKYWIHIEISIFPTSFTSVLVFITNAYYVKKKYTSAFSVMLESLLYSHLFLI